MGGLEARPVDKLAHLAERGAFTQESCDVPAIGSGDDGEAKPGLPISLMIKADPGTTWEILVYGTNVSNSLP